MVQLNCLLFLYFIGVLICCCNAGEDYPLMTLYRDTYFKINNNQAPPKKARSILEVFPNEILDQVINELDLPTLMNAASSNKCMVQLNIIRKTFVDAITKFREDVKKFGQGSNIRVLIDGFKKCIDACRYGAKEPDIVNSLRFIFLCKFIASLKPIDNEQWQKPINAHLSGVMSGHVDEMLKQGENENVKKFVIALSVYDYTALVGFLIKQIPSHTVKTLFYGFIMLIKNSEDHMQNRLPLEVITEYNTMRQIVNSFEICNDFKNSKNKSKFTLHIKFKLNLKLRKGGQSIDDIIDCHMRYINSAKSLLSTLIDKNCLRGNSEFLQQEILWLFCGIRELLQFKDRKNELIRKANINLAIFEIVGKRNKFVQLLTESLIKIQKDANTANTTLSHQLHQLDQFINPKYKLKSYVDCYLELLSPKPVEDPSTQTLAQLYVDEVKVAAENAIINILQPNGLKKYRDALEIFRNIGLSLSSMKEIRMNLYYAYHTAIFIPEMLDKNLKELIDLEQLHSETFEADHLYFLKSSKNTMFNFQDLLNKFFSKFGSDLNVSKDANERTEIRKKQRLLLKSAVLFTNEVYGIDFADTRRPRYITIRQQSIDNGEAAREQVLTTIKFFYASVSYNSEEIAKDSHIIVEYAMFCKSLTTEIITLYMNSEDEEFYFLHNPINEQSPASNSMFYGTLLYTVDDIQMSKNLGNVIPMPACLLRNILHFQTKFNLTSNDSMFIFPYSYTVYKMYSKELIDMAMENGELKAFVDTSLDWIINTLCYDPYSDSSGLFNLLKSVFGAIEKISNEEKTEEMLSKELILRLDHVAFGCFCEYPEAFKNSLESIYKAFRLKFKFEMKPRKQNNI